MLEWLDSGRFGATDFRLSGGTRPVTGALWLPEQYGADTPLVLCGHGASGDRYQAPLPHLARRFVSEYAFAVLAIDGPVHGLRQVGEGGRVAFFAEMQRDGFIDDMVADWHGALDAVRADKTIGGQLGYFGLSMGTIFGVPLLASDIAVTASVIGLCGTSGAAQIIGQRLAADAAKIQHPLLFLMQLEDELFDRDGYLALFDALASDDKRLHANPGLHPNVPAEEIAATVTFLGQHLSGNAPDRTIEPLAT